MTAMGRKHPFACDFFAVDVSARSCAIVIASVVIRSCLGLLRVSGDVARRANRAQSEE